MTWAGGWSVGEIVTASEFKKGLGAIYDTTLGSAVASIDITPLPTGPAHLLLVLYARGSNAVTQENVYLRLNNDSGANYDFQRFGGNGSTAYATEGIAQTQAFIGFMPGSSAPANVFGCSYVDLPHYSDSSNQQALYTRNSHKTGTATTNIVAEAVSGFWRSTQALNRITLLPGAGDFDVGTRVTLYVFGA